MYDQKFEFAVCLSGTVEINVNVNFDHTALAAKLHEATTNLKAAVDANQPPVPPVKPS